MSCIPLRLHVMMNREVSRLLTKELKFPMKWDFLINDVHELHFFESVFNKVAKCVEFKFFCDI